MKNKKTSLFLEKVTAKANEKLFLKKQKQKEEKQKKKMWREKEKIRYAAQNCMRKLVNYDPLFKIYMDKLFKKQGGDLRLVSKKYDVEGVDGETFIDKIFCLKLTKRYRLIYTTSNVWGPPDVHDYLCGFPDEVQEITEDVIKKLQTPEGVTDFFLEKFDIQ